MSVADIPLDADIHEDVGVVVADMTEGVVDHSVGGFEELDSPGSVGAWTSLHKSSEDHGDLVRPCCLPDGVGHTGHTPIHAHIHRGATGVSRACGDAQASSPPPPPQTLHPHPNPPHLHPHHPLDTLAHVFLVSNQDQSRGGRIQRQRVE